MTRHDAIPVLPPWRQLLVLTDLSVAGIHASWRAARLAREQGAALWLAALPPGPMHAVEKAAWQRATRRALRQLAEDIGSALKLPVSRAAGRPGDEQALLAAVHASDLVVMAPTAAQEPGWRFWRRDWVTRVLQDTRTPVLLARRPAGTHYRRLLLATTSAPDSARPMLACIQRVAPHADVEVVQVLSLGGRTRVSDQALEALTEARRMAHAQARRAWRAIGWEAGLPDTAVHVLDGSAPRVLLAHLRRQPSSLLVVGVEPRPGWRGLSLQPPWPQPLWAQTDSDLLCVPLPLKRRTAQDASERLRANLQAARA